MFEIFEKKYSYEETINRFGSENSSLTLGDK
jgi:hypothetical protein